MKASAFEFRFRMVIMTTLVVLGYWAPWIEALDLGRRISLLEWLAVHLSRAGLLPFGYATAAMIVIGSLFAAAGMILRVWGAAYLGYGAVHHGQMQAGAVMADGPYCYMRNPLYEGGWFMFMAMALLMPPSGALFAVPLLTLFLLRLILAEEAFLAKVLGESYKEYALAVPRLVPRLRSHLSSAGNKPRWITAILTEVNPVGVFLIMTFLAWTYDEELMLKALLISFGISLVVRAVMPRGKSSPEPA
jgi:protein-S-isoprenylcysteine O-methyltransferase Ste14